MSIESPTHYFVDEAGDGTLFSAKGKVLLGEAGCSRYFMLGLLWAREPERLAAELAVLRERLIADPYFSTVPSMKPESRKTALLFHAKDDLPEVRREVFALLRQHDLSFYAVVKDKQKVLEYVRQRNERDPAYRYHQNEVYDWLVRRLFKDRLHQHDAYRVVFATRGASDRTRAFADALNVARDRFAEKWAVELRSTIEVVASNPKITAELQATDYFLWALQRLYERREERYWAYVLPQVSLVMDVDDTRDTPYGRYYTKKKPLSLAALPE